MIFAAAAAGFLAISPDRVGGEGNYLSLSLLLFSISCIAAFLFCYGRAALHRAAFPLFFLLLAGPLPDWLLERIVVFLQNASAVATDWLFTASTIPFSRDGVILSLPRVTIEIAKECSGIRSSLILFLTDLVLGHLFLKAGWSKLALAVSVIPITIAKNALRIFVLATLGMYVDTSFLTGRLHHQGGIVFFAIGFVALWPVILLLQRFEKAAAGARADDDVHRPAVGQRD